MRSFHFCVPARPHVHCKALLALVALSLVAAASASEHSFRPSPEELREGYRRADTYQRLTDNATLNLTLTPSWIGDRYFWYVAEQPGGGRAYTLVDAEKAARRPAFDHQQLAQAISKETGRKADPRRLNLEQLQIATDLQTATFTFEKQRYKADLKSYTLQKLESEERPDRDPRRLPTASPDGQAVARLHEGQVQVRRGRGEWLTLSQAGSFARFHWTPDSTGLLALRLIEGDRREVHMIESSPKDGGRARLHTRLYDLPGDKLDTFEVFLLDATAQEKPVAEREHKLPIPPIIGGGQPWAGPPGVQWWRGKAIVRFPVRGYQNYQVIAIDPKTAKTQTLVNEQTETFVDLGRIMIHLSQRAPELIWRSERDGWGHLYLVDGDTGQVKNQITRGQYVVRSIEHVDEEARQILFSASSREAGEDPYHIHFYRVNFDGSGLTRLTFGDGTHGLHPSPGRKFYVTSWSRVDHEPVHELRRYADGKLVMELERGDIKRLLANGVPLAERFVAKGRDGETDIWGVVIRPTKFDPNQRYPIIENIYAGPQDAFVPKAFRPFLNMHRLAELGFIVVQIDGMGTAHRGKKFHDYAHKNIADAGFPDRILWMKALAEKYPYVDISRVGVYGTSAGGQNAAGALLFHPEFYKVGVASCGCHDNRMDKQWWNEQWMGYPVGPHYEDQSNITNANKLQGRLLLIVGEMDTNVPPESTYRLVDALIKARKEFDFLMIPGMGHSDGGPYGERKRRDFFVRWLHGVEPPNWNEPQTER
jgi:dipeptidyl aminopeptidase/acylaminoacyl peptidase